jgi:hypothetical protein
MPNMRFDLAIMFGSMAYEIEWQRVGLHRLIVVARLSRTSRGQSAIWWRPSQAAMVLDRRSCLFSIIATQNFSAATRRSEARR